MKVYLKKKKKNAGEKKNLICAPALPQVSLSIKFLNPFITLMLPSILIVLADIISFALPLGGGERNSFKVTLVLSFTMFLLILNNVLPGDSQCSPIIRQSATSTAGGHVCPL